jgi:hypothetical protein
MLVKKIHPDQRRPAYLAARVNEAKDVLRSYAPSADVFDARLENGHARRRTEAPYLRSCKWSAPGRV